MHRSACVNLLHRLVFNPTGGKKTRLIIKKKNERTNGHTIQSVPSQCLSRRRLNADSLLSRPKNGGREEGKILLERNAQSHIQNE